MSVDFTFGIITSCLEQSDQAWRDKMMYIFNSIRKQRIPHYEIIVVGGPAITQGRFSYAMHKCIDIIHIPFNENQSPLNVGFDNKSEHLDKRDYKSTHNTIMYKWGQDKNTGGIKPGWITRKKNLITKNAKYENIVFLHDYIALEDDWYKGFIKFGNDWDICMTKIKDIFGNRFRDWVTWDHPKYGRRAYLDYDDKTYKYNYISGSYWVAKKYVMEAEPLDESFLALGVEVLSGGKVKEKSDRVGEDVEWSLRIRKKYKYVMNKFSTVRHLKLKLTGDERLIRPPQR